MKQSALKYPNQPLLRAFRTGILILACRRLHRKMTEFLGKMIDNLIYDPLFRPTARIAAHHFWLLLAQ
jgi:hypothetical protein